MMEYNEEIISASLFQLDALLPAQYLETVCSTIHLEGEKKLMLAVLEDAISCFQNYIATKEKWEETQFCEAEEWIFAQDETIFIFPL
jgi:hypothetical protein